MTFTHLAPETVVELHEMGLRAFGGQEGGGHRGAHYEGVYAAVENAHNSYYENLSEVAASYAVYVAEVPGSRVSANELVQWLATRIRPHIRRLPQRGT